MSSCGSCKRNDGTSDLELVEERSRFVTIPDHTEVPKNEHEAFVISYCVHESSTKICYVLSTKRLLELAPRSPVIHADVTTRLNWQGFEIFIVGTTDVSGTFFPLCLAVSSTDTAEVFKTIFNGLKDAIASMYTCFFEPSVLVCDDEAISDTFTSIFTSPQVRTCWTHAKNEIKSAIEQMNEKKQNSILEDVESLHVATSREDFDIAAELFLLKWEEEQDFTNYFREEWLVRRRNWYLGYTNSAPTNDAIEAINTKIKDSKIIYERLPAKRFLITTCDIITDWSENKKIDSFSTKYSVELKDWAEAHQWLKMDRKTTILQSDDDKTTYLVQSSKSPPISRTTYLQSNGSWKTFDEYKEICYSHWKVTMIKDSQLWEDSKCTCPHSAVKSMCKHVLGLSVQMKYATIPVEATKMAPAKEHVKVKEENPISSKNPEKSEQNKSKKVYTLAAEQSVSEKRSKESVRPKKNLRKSRLRSEIESALRKEKIVSKRNSTVSWSEDDIDDSDAITPIRKTRSKQSKRTEKHVKKRSISTFSSEQNHDDIWSEQDWGLDDSSRDCDSRNIDSTNSNKKSKRESKHSMELRVDSSRNFDNKNSHSINRQEDEFYFFGQSMAAQLRRLPINVALDLQVQFQNELTKARTKSMSSGENIVHSSTSLEKNPLEGYEMTVILPNKIELDDSD